MWETFKNGDAINTETGDEMYMNLGSDGLIRVYCGKKIIFACKSVEEAKKFIADKAKELNEELADRG